MNDALYHRYIECSEAAKDLYWLLRDLYEDHFSGDNHMLILMARADGVITEDEVKTLQEFYDYRRR